MTAPSHPEARLHDDGRQRGRHDVPQQDPRHSRAQCPGGLHEVQLAGPQHLAADEPGVPDPSDDRQGQHDVGEAGAEHGDERDRQQDAREGQQHVDDARDHIVDPAPVVAGRRAEQQADERRHGNHGEPDQQRDTRAGQHPGEDVAAEFVEAEGMCERRAGQPVRQLLVGGVVRRQPRSQQGSRHRDQHDQRADAQHHVPPVIQGGCADPASRTPCPSGRSLPRRSPRSAGCSPAPSGNRGS